jgi:hypothetical protein
MRRQAALPLLIFGPFLLFAWLYLDFHSASRFSIGYMPLYALLAACGVPKRGRVVVLAAVIALAIVWMAPVLWIVHTTASPPVAAIAHLRASVDCATHVIYVDEPLAAHAALLLPEYERRIVRVVPPLVDDRRAVLLREGASLSHGARSFTRERDRLAGVVRNRYFEESVIEGRRMATKP